MTCFSASRLSSVTVAIASATSSRIVVYEGGASDPRPSERGVWPEEFHEAAIDQLEDASVDRLVRSA